jgi:DNA-binding NarL/FixJ family response regulator
VQSITRTGIANTAARRMRELPCSNFPNLLSLVDRKMNKHVQVAEMGGYDGSMRVWIEDSQAVFRLGLVGLLSLPYPNWRFDESDGSCSVLERLETRSIDLLIIEAERLFAVLACISSAALLKNSAASVIAITQIDSAISALASMVLGAQATISRSMTSMTILETIHSLKFQNRLNSPDESQSIFSRPREDAATKVAATFSKRQLDVLRLVAQGQPNKLIAHNLGLSISTVKVHLGAIFRGLGARNRVEAVVIANSCKDESEDAAEGIQRRSRNDRKRSWLRPKAVTNVTVPRHRDSDGVDARSTASVRQMEVLTTPVEGDAHVRG